MQNINDERELLYKIYRVSRVGGISYPKSQDYQMGRCGAFNDILFMICFNLDGETIKYFSKRFENES